MSIFLILLAAGKSKRLKSTEPKPYISVNNKTLIEHSIDKARKIKVIKKIVLVYNKKHKKKLDNLNIKNVIKVTGGNTRAQSTFLALKKIKKLNNIVFILNIFLILFIIWCVDLILFSIEIINFNNLGILLLVLFSLLLLLTFI